MIESVERVAENIVRICVPIPFPLRTVNIYVLLGEAGWVLFDTAIGTEAARETVFSAFEGLGLKLEALSAIVLSHGHPDHIGLSGELQARSGAGVYMHAIDEVQVQKVWNNGDPHPFNQAEQFFRLHGMPVDAEQALQVPREVMRRVISVPLHEAFTLVEDGQVLELAGEHYKVLWVPGHSDGQIVLLRERDGTFLAADHVLPRVTPNIGIYSEQNRPNPLDDYLHSLRKVEHLAASVVLPGHGEPFRDLVGRVHELIAHHEQREQQILHLLVARPQHAYQLTQQLFGQRLTSQDAWRMALAETLAHLEYSRCNGLVTRYQGADGLIVYGVV